MIVLFLPTNFPLPTSPLTVLNGKIYPEMDSRLSTAEISYSVSVSPARS